MAEPSPRPPRVFNSKALDDTNIEALNQLEKALIDNPFDYYSHVSSLSILHQGLQNTLYPGDGLSRDPRAYELLPTLREAYETMDRTYSLGETLWAHRIDDERILARNVEERMAMLELCQKATSEEPYSVRLWILYADMIGYLMACVWDPTPPENWSEEEKAIGKEIFTTELLMDTLQRGAEYVKYNLADSHQVWDRYLQLLQEDVERQPNQEKVRRLGSVLNDRLNQPHATWADTFSKFSTFTSRYNQENYEAIMEYTASQTAHIKKTYALREEFEFNILKASQAGDLDAEYYAFTRYLKWEKKTIGVSSFPIVNGLFERATLRFPVDASLWEDHVEFLIWQESRSVSLLDVLERANRHCPWSGSLWSHRILTLEAEQRPHEEVEHVKHSATKTGMLEHTDLEELMKVQIAWCGYLRRKAFDDPKATEDDADIAEVGIRSALELAHEMGLKKYGKDWSGDPKYRLERIHIKFWTQRGNMEEARHIWETLVKKQEDSYDFWYRYYIWEMVIWANQAVRDRSNAGQQLQTPSRATAVLEQGMQRLTTIDYPEPLAEMYVNHCEQHESALKVRSAFIERRRSELKISIRRQKEAVQASAAAAAAQEANHFADSSTKRKREDETDVYESAVKKSRQAMTDDSPIVAPSLEAPARAASEAGSTLSATQKRDREHASVIVRNLPSDATQTDIRKFFNTAGNVKNVVIQTEEDSVTATVEFESPEEAEYALTKETKGFNGHAITIKRGENTTLYVTNYPAHADEAYLRKFFEPYGQILQIRFPSLKFDTHRRFCYVQFLRPEEAVAATELDGNDVEGLQLVAKISDPGAKQKRSGATEEGREVFVGHLNWKTQKPQVEELFSKFGEVEKVHLLTYTSGKFKGNNKGSGFITFKRKEDAQAAAAEMDGKEFEGLKLHVEIAKPRGEAKPKFKAEIHNTASPEAREPTPGQAEVLKEGSKEVALVPAAERSMGILDIPDTVNDTRIKALVEPYNFKKITLVPQHSGAIVEFHDVADMGKASLALDGYEVDGKKIRMGTIVELKKMKGEYKPSTNFIQPKRVERPVARGGLSRRGGKPGLGFRSAASRSTDTGSDEKAAKSNQDFRAMLLGKKSEANTSTGENERGAET